ncbi:hypothetical protein CDAR_265491 [Caerostris darwini]|uniref:Uncharacterized protein n=1 Tax=Caerostris darwini TaxID=1538125 RepID=A0AAV4RDW4_9ARAC|nr:hypothetical protein CDAR_265491 [Caerostris darwini]
MFRNKMRRDHSEVNSRGGGGETRTSKGFFLSHRPRESGEVGGKDDTEGSVGVLFTLKKPDDKKGTKNRRILHRSSLIEAVFRTFEVHLLK